MKTMLMKKTLLVTSLFLMLIIFAGCGNHGKENGVDISHDIPITEIERYSMENGNIQHPVDLREIHFTETRKPIKANRNAMDAAASVIEKCHEQGRFSDYTLMSIVHSTEDNVWCFEYAIDQRNTDAADLVDCGGFYVAMDGNDGTLIQAWIEE